MAEDHMLLIKINMQNFQGGLVLWYDKVSISFDLFTFACKDCTGNITLWSRGVTQHSFSL